MARFSTLGLGIYGSVGFAFVLLTSCDNSGIKTFQPVVAKIGSQVKAISSEDAETICQSNYCETNQIYVEHFGHRHDDPPPGPDHPVGGVSPTVAPYVMPAQPSEMIDYSRTIVNAQTAWNITEGSPAIIVAVVDSGIDYFHPDLVANLATDAPKAPGYVGDTYGWDFYHERPNAYDDDGHGTHVSGIIAAADNGIGIRGIAPNVKILPVKFLGPDGTGDTADAVTGINYAVARGARIISNSWGGGTYSQLLNDAIQSAVNQGVIFVAASGNNGVDTDSAPEYPANYPNVVSVGSSDSMDMRSSFSNYGTASVEIFAPGTSILSTYPGGTYRVLSGTSMAAPQVSGALALALSVNPSLTPVQAVADLCSSADPVLTTYSKCGRLNVGTLVTKVRGY